MIAAAPRAPRRRARVAGPSVGTDAGVGTNCALIERVPTPPASLDAFINVPNPVAAPPDAGKIVAWIEQEYVVEGIPMPVAVAGNEPWVGNRVLRTNAGGGIGSRAGRAGSTPGPGNGNVRTQFDRARGRPVPPLGR